MAQAVADGPGSHRCAAADPAWPAGQQLVKPVEQREVPR